MKTVLPRLYLLPFKQKLLMTDWGCSPTLLKIYHTYPTMMKLGRVIPYLKTVQKTCKSRDTTPDIC